MITKVNRKTFIIRPSGRSTDFISPSFGHGCLYNCSYCYMKRHKEKGLSVAINTGDILTSVNNHAYFTPVDKPNQKWVTDITYIRTHEGWLYLASAIRENGAGQILGYGLLDDMTSGGVAYLLTPQAVPVPPALWLFGSGLIGLVGIARRKKAA